MGNQEQEKWWNDEENLKSIEYYGLIDQEIHREHNLIANRMNWYVTSQSFLMAAFAALSLIKMKDIIKAIFYIILGIFIYFLFVCMECNKNSFIALILQKKSQFIIKLKGKKIYFWHDEEQKFTRIMINQCILQLKNIYPNQKVLGEDFYLSKI
jgi:hypothetical protein